MTIEFLQQLFNLVLVPLLAILTAYIVKLINTQSEKLKSSIDNEIVIKYIGFLNDLIVTCVMATNQTYVDALKDQNAFTEEAQKQAFEMTYNTIKNILSDEMEKVLSMVYEDLDSYIKEQIEFRVKCCKNN